MPPARSLLRIWRKKQAKRKDKWVDITDDLTSFRNTIILVNKQGKPMSGIEIGRGGFAIRGIAPVFNENNKQVGSLEVLSDFNQLFSKIKTNDDENLALFMDYKFIKVATGLREDNTLDNRYVVVAANGRY